MAPYSKVTWQTVFNMSIKESDDKLIEFLTCSVSPNIIRNYLNVTNNPAKDCIKQCKNAKMLTKEHINRFFFTVAKHAKNQIILSYIIENFEKIKPR